MGKVKVTTLPCKFGGVSVTKPKDGDTLGIGLSFSRTLLTPGRAVALFLDGPLSVLLKVEAELFAPIEVKAVGTSSGVGCRQKTYRTLLRILAADVDVRDVVGLAGKSGTMEITDAPD